MVDDTDKVAFTRQAEEDDSAFPKLLRRWPLTLIDSALLLYLRQELSSVSGSGQRVVVGLDEIVDHLRPYRDDSATDHALQLRRIHASVAKMRDNGVLRPTATDDRYEIAPVLRLLLPPEQIAALVRAYDRLAGGGHLAPVELPDAAGPADVPADRDDPASRDDPADPDEAPLDD